MASPDLESPPISSDPLLADFVGSDPPPVRSGGALRLLAISICGFLLLAVAAALTISGMESGSVTDPNPLPEISEVSDSGSDLLGLYPWTNNMLSWQRTGFHFQPEKNWMNDPNGPLFYKGWYHFFYQHNPVSATWGNISWGHAVSDDLVHWKHLPLAMEPDRWYDQKGALTGSATLLHNGSIVMLYTGWTNESVQVQNLAVPADLNDPLLINWTKADHANPVLVPPPGIGDMDFRDPSTAWFEPSDSTWRIAIGAKDSSHTGMALVYSTKDFIHYDLLDGVLHSVKSVGEWECIDFYPIATAGRSANRGLDPSARPGTEVKHVLKASPEDYQHDFYAIGTYNPATNKWIPDDETLDVGIGLKYDYGKFYAGKTFYDQEKGRRVLWGWIGETDTQTADLAKGWASLQGIPRTVLFDMKTGSNLLLWPVEEVEKLRFNLNDFSGITVESGSTIPLDVGGGAQLDIEAEFLVDTGALESTIVPNDVVYDCSTSGGSANRGVLGPFGLLVLANGNLTEHTTTYFYISRGTDGNVVTHFCQDESRSSKASDVVKRIVGHTVPVLDGETLSLRILVDHSIVESFAQGGRACATSRVYPTEAIYDSARVFLFNNATGAAVTMKSLKIWHMNSTFNHQFNFNNFSTGSL